MNDSGHESTRAELQVHNSYWIVTHNIIIIIIYITFITNAIYIYIYVMTSSICTYM